MSLLRTNADHIHRAALAAGVQAGLSLLCVALFWAGVFPPTEGLDGYTLIDAALLAALSYGVYRRSRVAIVILLALAIVGEVFALFVSLQLSIFRLFFLYFYARAALAIFEVRKSAGTSENRAEPDDKAGDPPSG